MVDMRDGFCILLISFRTNLDAIGRWMVILGNKYFFLKKKIITSKGLLIEIFVKLDNYVCTLYIKFLFSYLLL